MATSVRGYIIGRYTSEMDAKEMADFIEAVNACLHHGTWHKQDTDVRRCAAEIVDATK